MDILDMLKEDPYMMGKEDLWGYEESLRDAMERYFESYIDDDTPELIGDILAYAEQMAKVRHQHKLLNDSHELAVTRARWFLKRVKELREQINHEVDILENKLSIKE